MQPSPWERNMNFSQVVVWEKQKQQQKPKVPTAISATRTKDQFLPRVLMERIQRKTMAAFPSKGSLQPRASLPVRQGPWTQLSAV